MSQHLKIVIPARYDSSRFPGKPLAKIKGKEMILHVVERALRTDASEVVVATDNIAIFQCVVDAGHTAVMTSSICPSGTDRVAEAVDAMGWSDNVFVINIQGDEPLINPKHIHQLYVAALRYSADVHTLCAQITDENRMTNPNVVKVVTDGYWKALYFSRAPIPFSRDGTFLQAYQHIGVYGYRVRFLKELVALHPPIIEQTEELEQLRVLWYGKTIRAEFIQDAVHPGVDTPEDLIKINDLLS